MSTALVLSIFPGIDLLGMGFEASGWCVVRGPDPIFGGDVRTFRPVRNVFTGIIGGPPCQDFSDMRRTEPTGQGADMLAHFRRCVIEANPLWFLMENVRRVPSIAVPGYTVQRMHVRASEFGAAQHRLRIFQFGYRDGAPLILRRPVTTPKATQGAALASEGRTSKRRGWPEFCALQGLTKPLELPGMTVAAKYRAVGNGVDVRVATAIAEAIAIRHTPAAWDPPCACGCGRPVHGKRSLATAACRKRAQRTRDGAAASAPRRVTVTELATPAPGLSHPCEFDLWNVCKCAMGHACLFRDL